MNIMKHSILAILKRPLMKAIILRDAEMLVEDEGQEAKEKFTVHTDFEVHEAQERSQEELGA